MGRSLLPAQRQARDRVLVREPLPVTHPETGDPMIYCGRSDMVASFAGSVYPFDDKTTSSLGPTWAKQWEMRSQFTGYVWAAQRAGYPASGVIVRGVSILKTKYDTQQAITNRAPFELERWLAQTVRDVERMKAAWASNIWDFNLDHACAEYGGCQFVSVCKSPNPEEWLPLYFEPKVWDPLAREELSVEAYNAQWEKGPNVPAKFSVWGKRWVSIHAILCLSTGRSLSEVLRLLLPFVRRAVGRAEVEGPKDTWSLWGAWTFIHARCDRCPPISGVWRPAGSLLTGLPTLTTASLTRSCARSRIAFQVVDHITAIETGARQHECTSTSTSHNPNSKQLPAQCPAHGPAGTGKTFSLALPSMLAWTLFYFAYEAVQRASSATGPDRGQPVRPMSTSAPCALHRHRSWNRPRPWRQATPCPTKQLKKTTTRTGPSITSRAVPPCL